MKELDQSIILAVSMEEDGICTHDLFNSIGGEDVIPRKELYPLLKVMEKVGKLRRGHGKDSRGKLGFKWSLNG